MREERRNNLDIFKERYRQYMQVMNRSTRTIEEYLYKMEHFTNYLYQIGVTDINEIRKGHIAGYQKEVYYKLNNNGRQNLAQTQNNYIITVKSFFYFLKSQGYIGYNPAIEIEYAKTPRQLPRTVLTEEEIKKILRQPDINTAIGYRDKAILELLYSTGIRRQEALNLRVRDVDYEKGYLRVNRGKGNKDRIVPLGKIACKYIENYIKLVRIDLVKTRDERGRTKDETRGMKDEGGRTKDVEKREESRYLFLSKRGNSLSTRAISHMIKKYTKKAKIKKTVTPHVFRHTMATHLIRKKANIRCVQEILGHKSLDTTQKYTRITIMDLKEAHQNCHPREREKEF